jgi:hypothetical protein
MSYDENKSSEVKADNPLTPKRDSSWMEALPIKRQPWDKPERASVDEAAMRCVECGHAPHPPGKCLNMASDSDCNCVPATAGERHEYAEPLVRHEFNGHADAPETWCTVPTEGTEHGYCGQPRSAPCHRIDPFADDPHNMSAEDVLDEPEDRLIQSAPDSSAADPSQIERDRRAESSSATPPIHEAVEMKHEGCCTTDNPHTTCLERWCRDCVACCAGISAADFNEVAIIVSGEVVAKSAGPSPALDMSLVKNASTSGRKRLWLSGSRRCRSSHCKEGGDDEMTTKPNCQSWGHYPGCPHDETAPPGPVAAPCELTGCGRCERSPGCIHYCDEHHKFMCVVEHAGASHSPAVTAEGRDSAEVRHLLHVLIEECSEVQKVCTKALRFGLDDTYRADNGIEPQITPRQELRHELNDLGGTLNLMQLHEVIPPVDGFDDAERADKVLRILSMMDYAKERGML